MKSQKKLIKLFSTAAVAAMSVSSLFAQTNLGADCGCPSVASRPTVLLSSLAGSDGQLTAKNTILSCDKMYILDKKIYVDSLKSLTIQPGTVIRGRKATDGNANALIVQRDAKIFASGTATCPIVFTAEADLLDGKFPVATTGQWGGIVILGKSFVNLTVAKNTTTGSSTRYCAGVDGTGFIEGFSASNVRNIYGGAANVDEDDNSGILKYVSIRHAGDVLPVIPGTPAEGANELNGLSLGAVGRGTTIENVEIISSADDNIEFFGGTVNVKYITTMFGADDMFDFDLGYKGKAQFYFGVKTATNDTLTTIGSDNGIEADADDDKAKPAHALRSHPIIYNSTFIGNNRYKGNADNSGPAGIQAKELVEGEFYNNIFANFRTGVNFATARSNASNGGDAYDNWTNVDNAYNTGTGVASKGSLIIKNNTFFGNRYPITKGSMTTGKWSAIVSNPADGTLLSLGTADELTQFTTDGNTVPTTIDGFNSVWAMNSTTNAVATVLDVIPTNNIATTITAPADGFFTPAAYRGAFDATKPSWLSGWAYATVLKTSAGLQSNPTDINQDGITNVTDFNLLLGKFNQPNK